MIEIPDPEWIELLRAEIDKGRSIAEVAREIGMARPSLSMLLAGTYPARIDKVTAKYGAKVTALYRNRVLCPFLRQGIPAEECRAHASAPMSTSNPERLRHWAACRACPMNPFAAQADPACAPPSIHANRRSSA
ncbi:helix-turn-helix domain-containing protein [Rhodovulum strictum]|nr:helix-turn-helix transcriptional regulator [Rhodovulum strictum]